MKLAVVILSYNAARLLPAVFDGISIQRMQPGEVIVLDSNSRDSSCAIASARGARVVTHGERKFNHGGTRRWGSELTEAEIIVYLTHDAVPADEDCFANIVSVFDRVPDAGASFGRQLAYPAAGPLGRHHREFNYPQETRIKRLGDAKSLGIKTGFLSDSFSAYRRDRLMEIGGFPEDVISCEDQHVGARMILAGYSLVYAGAACVYHSHDYSVVEEFRRYFDNGAFYAMNPWIMDKFGGASGEGIRFVRSELAYLVRTGRWDMFPKALAGTAAKYAGFKAGLNQARFSNATKRRLSMFSGYWA